jgi:hypothetical protein
MTRQYLNQQATTAPFVSREASAAERLRSSRLVFTDDFQEEGFPDIGPNAWLTGGEDEATAKRFPSSPAKLMPQPASRKDADRHSHPHRCQG